MEDDCSTNVCTTIFDREKLKEERNLRNKQKREAKKLEKLKQKSKLDALYNIRPQGSNVNLITPHFANFATRNNSVASNQKDIENLNLTENDFPRIGETPKIQAKVKDITKSSDNIPKNEIKRNTKSRININLLELLNTSTKVPQTKQKVDSSNTTYSGNPLDSAQPQRSKGKHKEGQAKKKETKLKRVINEEIANELPQEFFAYCNAEKNPNFETAITAFLKKLVGFQEKLYKKNPLKGQIKKRYVVGFHEVKKYLKLGRLKILLIATNVKVLKENDALHCVIKEVVEIARKEDVNYYFTLSRRKLGNIMLKYMPISCVGILNYEGAEDEYKLVREEFVKINNDMVDGSRNSGEIITMEPLSSLINNVISTLKDSS